MAWWKRRGTYNTYEETSKGWLRKLAPDASDEVIVEVYKRLWEASAKGNRLEKAEFKRLASILSSTKSDYNSLQALHQIQDNEEE